MNVNKTRDMGLCVSCEICNASCPVEAIKMEYVEGQFHPIIDGEKCIDCSLCLKLCPGIDIPEYSGDNFIEWATGEYLEGYSAYCKDERILNRSTSGGLITAMIIELIEREIYKGAFVLPFDMFDGEPARLSFLEKSEDLLSSSKSKYIPASVFKVIKALDRIKKPNFIIVGTACQITGIKKFIKLKGIDDSGLLFLGLFCEKTLNYHVLKYFEDKFSHEDEKLIKFDFRNKEKNGWPGHPKLYFDSGRTMIVSRKERIEVKDHFQLERCLYCTDKLNHLADISFGDCYISGKESPGRSSIIIRSQKGKDIWEDVKHLFDWERSSVGSIVRSQHISGKETNLDFAKILRDKESFYKDLNTSIDRDIRKKLSRSKKKIKLGKRCDAKKIQRSIRLDHIKEKFHLLGEMIKLSGDFTSFLIKDILKDPFLKKKGEHQGDNIIIVGGQLFNKGAQAMTFTAVDVLKRKYPEKNIYLYSLEDAKRDEVEKYQYAFDFLNRDIKQEVNLLNPSRSQKSDQGLKELKTILDNTYLMVDISGYALSSQTRQKGDPFCYGSSIYLLNILLAKKYSIPFYILPQSLGPFDYPPQCKIYLIPLLKRYLKYPEKIYCRERDGLEQIKQFTRSNIHHSMDIVLLNDRYDLDNIFSKKVRFKDVEIPDGSVGIIPNMRVKDRVKDERFFEIYKKIMDHLLENGKKVFLLRHAEEDLSICNKLKEIYRDDENVVLIQEDFNAIELEGILKQFEFVVASRYHSIIHSYRKGVPALVLGWAIKYQELLESFHQNRYLFDIRSDIDQKEIIGKLDIMLDVHRDEGRTILQRLKEIREKEGVSNVRRLV